MELIPAESAARLYDLLERASFRQLTEDEAEFVRQYLPPAEYDRLHQLGPEARLSLQTQPVLAAPDPAVHARLQATLRQKHAQRSVAWWRRPVPAYQLAVAAVLPLLFFYASALWQTAPPVPAAPPVQVVYQKIVDTLYLPARGVKAQMLHAVKPTNVHPSLRSAQVASAVRKPARTQFSAQQVEMMPMLAQQPFTLSAPSNKGFSGRSLSDDSALTRFIVRVN